MRSYRHWLLWFAGLGAVLALAASVTQSAKAQSYGLVTTSTGGVRNITAATYTAPVGENGYVYTNYGTATSLIITLPLTPPPKQTYTFVCTDAANFYIAFNANTGAVIKGTSGSSSSGGNVVTAGSNTVSVTVTYVGAPSGTSTWVITASNGVAPTNYGLN